MNLTADVTKNDLLHLANGLGDKASQVVRKTGLDIQGGAVVRSRRDTGAMANAWAMEMEDAQTAVVYNPQAYAPANEYGTAHMSAQPMATPAAEEAMPGFVEAMRQVLNDV